MSSEKAGNPSPTPLVIRKTVRASVDTVFEAWTQAEHLKRWWGPRDVECIAAEIDLRVGGRYRLANQFPDGKVIWIAGEFEIVERPHRLVYSWHMEVPGPATLERVTVEFQPRGQATEVTITHDRIADEKMRTGHEQGWAACLDGLAEYLGSN